MLWRGAVRRVARGGADDGFAARAKQNPRHGGRVAVRFGEATLSRGSVRALDEAAVRGFRAIASVRQDAPCCSTSHGLIGKLSRRSPTAKCADHSRRSTIRSAGSAA